MILTKIEEVREALKVILTKNVRVGLLGASAGSGLMSSLASLPDLTKVFYEAYFPHAKEATSEYLGFIPDNFVCEDTAIEQAMRAYYRAYQPDGKRTIGIGATAAIASSRAHRGDHRVWVGVFSEGEAYLYYAKLKKGVGEEVRDQDNLACDLLIASALLLAIGDFSTSIQLPDNVEESHCVCVRKGITELVAKRPFFRSDGARLGWDDMMHEFSASGVGVYPGSFTVPHFGHFGVADAFTDRYHQPVVFAIEVTPPHKDALSPCDMLKRAKLLKGRNVIFTWGAPYYFDKAKLFPNTKIILGADAFVQLLDAKWGFSTEDLQRAFSASGTSLIVPDRLVNEVFTTLDDLKPPAGFPCERLPVRFDISSSELMKNGAMGVACQGLTTPGEVDHSSTERSQNR